MLKSIETLYLRGAAIEDRSTMNATFLLNDDAHAETFDAMWKQQVYLDFRTSFSRWL
jgi:hypothetical protein